MFCCEYYVQRIPRKGVLQNPYRLTYPIGCKSLCVSCKHYFALCGELLSAIPIRVHYVCVLCEYAFPYSTVPTCNTIHYGKGYSVYACCYISCVYRIWCMRDTGVYVSLSYG